MGLNCDARTDELVNLARAVPRRVPGAGSYETALALVGDLNRTLRVETDAQMLHRAGHVDKKGGNHWLGGLFRLRNGFHDACSNLCLGD